MKGSTVFFVSAFLLFQLPAIGQQNKVLEGQVTFTTTSSTYVRFESTEMIQLGDTLRRESNGQLIPCLVVTRKSSISTVCKALEGCKPAKGDIILSFPGTQKGKAIAQNTVPPSKADEYRGKSKERINGSISAASYMNHSSIGGDNMRNMLRLSVNAANINDSKFSAETYATYRQLNRVSENASLQQPGLLNIYTASVSYEVDSTLQVSLGRKINRKAASLGPIDGLQVEKQFGNFYAGALAGFRPDLIDHSFNSNLLQYGGFFGVKTSGRDFVSKTTAGLLQQQNSGAIDRRYLYFQHSSTINSNLSLFSSLELDLYNLVDSVNRGGNPRLTNFYLSVRYRVNPKINFNISYDNRRRIIFYETFRTNIEELLANDQARQGIRLRVNVRPYKYVNASLSYGRRFQNNNQNQSDNINGYVSYSNLPQIGGRASINFNYNRSAYLTSAIVSLRHSRSVIPKKFHVNLYARNVMYDYVERNTTINQQYFGAGFSYYITPKLVFNALGEYSMRPTENNRRINLRIIKRF